MCLITVRTQQCRMRCKTVLYCQKGLTALRRQASKQVCKKKPIYFCDNLYQEPPSFRSICLVTPWQFFSSLLRQYANNTFEKTIGNASYDIIMLHYVLWTWPNYFVVVRVVNIKCLTHH